MTDVDDDDDDSVISRVYRNADMDGLTVSQFGVLEALLHLGPMCQRELGAKILKSSGNITMVIDNLEKRDLVERKRDRGDRRFVTVYLTEPGTKMIKEIFPGHLERIKKEFRILNSQQQADLGRLCKDLGHGREN